MSINCYFYPYLDLLKTDLRGCSWISQCESYMAINSQIPLNTSCYRTVVTALIAATQTNPPQSPVGANVTTPFNNGSFLGPMWVSLPLPNGTQIGSTFFLGLVVVTVLWRCWLGGRKGIWPVKTWVVGCWHGYLSGARCRLAYGPADATATHRLLLQ